MPPQFHLRSLFILTWFDAVYMWLWLAMPTLELKIIMVVSSMPFAVLAFDFGIAGRKHG
jgi:hypothetical protein